MQAPARTLRACLSDTTNWPVSRMPSASTVREKARRAVERGDERAVARRTREVCAMRAAGLELDPIGTRTKATRSAKRRDPSRPSIVEKTRAQQERQQEQRRAQEQAARPQRARRSRPSSGASSRGKPQDARSRAEAEEAAAVAVTAAASFTVMVNALNATEGGGLSFEEKVHRWNAA